MATEVHTRTVRRIADIPPEQWDALSTEDNPFLCHAFLLALEQQRCLGRRVGWFPSHLAFADDTGRLLGAMPLYLKANSFGEFVFDWSWANAHEDAGLPYYPKAVIAAPFTPATGPRLLIRPEVDRRAMGEAMVEAAIRTAGELGLSSLHWLFGNDAELSAAPKLLARKGCQFHWENPGYRDFADFLESLTAKRRKEIRRERRRVAEAGVSVRRVEGDRATEDEWRLFHRLYCRTFAKHGNYAALQLDFFQQLGQSMGRNLVLEIATVDGQDGAAALFFQGGGTLYGRYWGAFDETPALHFEVCYYRGIEYCIENSLKRFEPGAQGEHKVSRGFDPRATWSYHWIAHPGLRDAIERYLRQETAEVDAYMARIMAHSAYRVGA